MAGRIGPLAAQLDGRAVGAALVIGLAHDKRARSRARSLVRGWSDEDPRHASVSDDEVPEELAEPASTDDVAFAALLDGARAGDERAWAQLFAEHAGPVLGYLRLRGAPDAQDLAAEVFLKVARSIGTFEGDERGFCAWVFTIAHRQLLDEVRRRRRAPIVVPLDVDAGAAGSATSPLAALPTPEEQLDGHTIPDELQAGLDALTADQRAVVLLRVLGGFTLDEVAQVLGKESNAIKQLQHRALAALRRTLPNPAVVSG